MKTFEILRVNQSYLQRNFSEWFFDWFKSVRNIFSRVWRKTVYLRRIFRLPGSTLTRASTSAWRTVLVAYQSPTRENRERAAGLKEDKNQHTFYPDLYIRDWLNNCLKRGYHPDYLNSVSFNKCTFNYRLSLKNSIFLKW